MFIKQSETIEVFPASSPIRGRVSPPPDKSITHRMLLFAAINNGITTIRNPSRAADPVATYNLLHSLGYGLRDLPDRWEFHGFGPLGPLGDRVLDCGNSGTTARMAAGLLTGEEGRFTLMGDDSLSGRPMSRVAEPLEKMGAKIRTTGGRLPMVIEADGALRGMREDKGLSVFSAQVHGSLVLAALRSKRGVILRRSKPMRDHTVRIARAFGADISTHRHGPLLLEHVEPGLFDIDLDMTVPGDVSSASFLIAAAVLVPGSSLVLDDVGLNPTRIAFLETLAAMGAHIAWYVTEEGFEPKGRVEVEYSSRLGAITLGEREFGEPLVSEMMDELPLLALVAARARGTTRVSGAIELRVKESDRLAGTAALLASLGVEMTELDDGFEIKGPQRIIGGGVVEHYGDHRLCMIAAVAALAAYRPVTIMNPEVVDVSYPTFWSDLDRIVTGKS